jgi:AhpD family alkylhydroperoxidase
MLNTVTSRANNCFYCVSSHAEFLSDAAKDKDLAAKLKSDYRQAKLPVKERRMLDFVDKLTRSPWLMTKTDIQLLREAGHSELDIVHIVLGSSQYTYLNRVANGIGIKFEYKTELPEFRVPASGDAVEPPDSVAMVPQETTASAVAWIQFPEAADPDQRRNEPRNLFRALGGNTPARDGLRKWRDYQLKGTSALDVKKRAQIGLFVSGLNRCQYSSFWFSKMLREQGTSEADCRRLAEGKPLDNLSPLDALIFKHAERLTRRSWTTTETDIRKLREAGLDDHGILQLTMLCSYLNFENRVAAGLGVEREG